MYKAIRAFIDHEIDNFWDTLADMAAQNRRPARITSQRSVAMDWL